MPPRDPRLCPDLETARPSAVAGPVDVLAWPELWSVRFGGKAENWRAVRVRARSVSPDGREVIHCEWSAGGSTWQETYFADGGKMERRA